MRYWVYFKGLNNYLQGLWGIFYYNYNKEPLGNSLGPYIGVSGLRVYGLPEDPGAEST